MTNHTPTRRLVALVALVALAASACSSGISTEPPELPTPSTSPPTTAPPSTAPPSTAPPTAQFEMVTVSIDEIGVTAQAPDGWERTPAGLYAGPDAVLEFAAEQTAAVPDPTEFGFERLDRRNAAGRTWDLYTLDAGASVIGVALTEIGGMTYSVAIDVAPHLADEYLESVVMPVLESFEAAIPPELVVTLAGPPPVDGDLGTVLDAVVGTNGLPAVGVTVFEADGVVETDVAGVRRVGDPTPVELTDQFSIGSNVKAMTATLVGTFVDDGTLTWDTTVADVYSDDLGALDPAMATVTIRQLLTHTAGLNDDEAGFGPAVIGETDRDRPLVDQRVEIARRAFTHPPQHAVGDYMYSNIGYTTIGAMLEHVTGQSYEFLLRERIFDVLGMDGCGFYAPGTPGQLDQPWGHHDGQFDLPAGLPVAPGDPAAELNHVVAPAGTVHCTMADWTTFLQSQLRGFRGSDTEVVSAEVFAALATPAPGTDYALGWTILPGPNETRMIWHNGSNMRFTSEAFLLPDEDRGMLVVTNVGVAIAQPILERLAHTMFTRYADAA